MPASPVARCAYALIKLLCLVILINCLSDSPSIVNISLAKYNQLKSEVEQSFEKASVKPLYKELAQLQQAYNTAKKPFLMRESKWSSNQAEERTKLRQLERQISVAEANSKGKFEQKAKDWIATNKPDDDKGYQNASRIIKEHNEIQQQQNTQQTREQRVNVVRDREKDIER